MHPQLNSECTWTHIVILTLAEPGLPSRHEQQALHLPAFLCPVHVMQHTWITLVPFGQWACIRSICGPTKESRRTTQLQASSDSFSNVCPSPSLAVTTAGTGAQSINRSPKAFDSGSFLPHPHSITLSVFTRWPPLMRMYMYAWIKHEIHCFW